MASRSDDGVDVLRYKHMSNFKQYDTSWQEKSLFSFWELPRNNNLESKAKELRKAGILAEVLFWKTFKDKKKLDFDIDRQVIIGNYIVDFFIPELGLIFEIDGSTHNHKKEYDEKRDAYLKSFGLEIVHILNGDIKINMDFVYKFVIEKVKLREKELRGNKYPPRLASQSTPQEGNL